MANSDEFIHLRFNECTPVRPLLEMMIQEYAFPKEDTQKILMPLVLALLMYVARQYRDEKPMEKTENFPIELSDT